MSKISILVPAYNVAGFLSDTIKSVLNQTYQDWEMLILDDCSTDETYSVAKSWEIQDSRIRVKRNEANLGMLGNWNKGISLCAHPFFVKLDADDIWHPAMLEKAMKVLSDRPEVGLVFSRYINIDSEGKPIAGSDEQLPSFARNQPFSCIDLVKEGPDKMLSYPVLRQGLSVMRKEVFERVGIYKYLLSKETQAATDTEFYFRVGAHYPIYCIDEVLYQYRVHQHSISALDHKKYLSDKKLYEIKHCIIRYYASQGILAQGEAAKYLNSIERTYSFSKVAYLRKDGNKSEYLRAFVLQFIRYPLSSSAFYFKRLLEKRNSYE